MARDAETGEGETQRDTHRKNRLGDSDIHTNTSTRRWRETGRHKRQTCSERDRKAEKWRQRETEAVGETEWVKRKAET